MFGFLKKNNIDKAIISNSYLSLANIFRFRWSKGGWYFSNSRDAVLRVNMFYACVRLLSNSIATTPINIINKNNKSVDLDLQFLLKNKPNSQQTAFDFWLKIAFDLLVFGNAYVLKTYSGDKVISLQPLSPEYVQIEWNTNSTKRYLYNTNNGIKEFNQEKIIHYKMLSLDGLYGLKPLDLLIDTFNVNSKLNKFLELDNFPPVLKTPEELLQDEQVEKLSGDLREKLPQKPIVLPKDFELILSNSHSAFDKKFAELKKFSNEEIARFFNIPFGLVGLDGASQPNVLDTQNRMLLQYALNPYLRMIEQTTENSLFDRNSLLNGYRVKFNRNAILMQTDANQRADYYGKMKNDLGVYDNAYIKELEDIYA